MRKNGDIMLLNSERQKIEQMFASDTPLSQDDLRFLVMKATCRVYKKGKIGYIFCLVDNNWIIWYNINIKSYEKPEKTTLYDALMEV